MTSPAPYGSWRSPITAASIAQGAMRLAEPWPTADGVYWIEMRPAEQGRYAIARQAPDGRTEDAIPGSFNARTRVHEYGGGSYLVGEGEIFFSNFTDQRIHRFAAGGEPRPITPEPAEPAGLRYADGRLTADGRLIVCVRENHEGGKVENELVAVPADGAGAPSVLARGHDFYSFPRISPDGTRAAWTCWDHPRMPWDGTELWVAPFSGDAGFGQPERVAGRESESVFQPEWSPDGSLHFVSDRNGWWNLYRRREGGHEPLTSMEAEFGVPQWAFGCSTYTFLPDGRIACTYFSEGRSKLGVLRPGSGSPEEIETAYVPVGLPCLRSRGMRVTFVGGSPTEAPAVVSLDLETGALDVHARSMAKELDRRYISVPQPLDYESEGETAHALFYAPVNVDVEPPADARPPLVVMSHGGPTGSAEAVLDPEIQFWTSRGLAVVDVNYGGSTGYGRQYRERLRGRWGEVDTIDCLNAARHLAEIGEVDRSRLAIRGGSAGGYTTLCALAFHDLFAAGASYYGVADAELLARETHKFESRYLDSLIGPYPDAIETYRARSPIHAADRIACPVILFQGLEDQVVPPSQAEEMVAALERNRVPHAYLAFEGEQHGFRRAATIRRALEAELYFYARILGFEPADVLEPVPIENL